MSLSDQDIDAIAERVVAKLRGAAPAPAVPTSADDVISSAEVMAMLRVKSAPSLCRMLKKLGVRRIGQNRYRRGDIENAVARVTLPRLKKAGAAG